MKTQTVKTSNESLTYNSGGAGVEAPSGTGFKPHPNASSGVELGVPSTNDSFNPEDNADYIRIALESYDWEMVTSLTENWSPKQKREVWMFLTTEERKALISMRTSQTVTISSQEELRIGQQYQIKLVQQDEWVTASLIGSDTNEDESLKRAMFTINDEQVIPIYNLEHIRHHAH